MSEKYATRELSTWAMAFQGFAAYRLGNLDHARRIFNQSAKIATEINTYVGKIFTALLSLPMAAQGAQGETMLEAYTGLKQNPIVANSVFFDRIIGQQIESLFADISAQTREEISMRGSALPINEILASMMGLLNNEKEEHT